MKVLTRFFREIEGFFRGAKSNLRPQSAPNRGLALYFGSPSAEPFVVLDIGCRWGFADRLVQYAFEGKLKIFGFDPDGEECDRLAGQYKSAPPGFITFVPLGLAEQGGRRSLYLTKEPACSSFHRPIKSLWEKYPALHCITPIGISSTNVTTLKDWAMARDLSSFDYIKIDTQGTELEILKGAQDLLPTARCIDIEVEFNSLYENQSLFGETDVFLRSQGFVLWRINNLVHYSSNGISCGGEKPLAICFDDRKVEIESFGGQLFWADARYIKADVISKSEKASRQAERDLALFEMLMMPDIASEITKTANLS